MGILSKSFSSAGNSLLIDIESGAVTFAVYSEEALKKRSKDAVLFVRRVFIPEEKIFDRTKVEEEMNSAMAACREGTEKFGKLSNTYVSVGAPWVYVKTVTASKTWETPVEITDDIVKNVLQEEGEKKTPYHEYFRNFFGNIVEPVRTLRSSKEQYFINGYPFPTYHYKKGRELTVVEEDYVFIQWILKLIEKECERYNSAPPFILSYNAIIPFFEKELEYLFVMMGAYTTEVGYIDTVSRSVRFLEEFPIGEKTLVNAVERSGKKTSAEAESLINMHVEKRLDTQLSPEDRRILSNVEGEWVKEFEKILHKFSEEAEMPATVFAVPFERAGWLNTLIRSESFTQPRLPEKAFNVILSEAFQGDELTFLANVPYPRLALLFMYLAQTLRSSILSVRIYGS